MLAALAAGCGLPTPTPTETALPDLPPPVVRHGGTSEIAERYQFLREGAIPADQLEEVRRRLPWTRIELERTPCPGACPSYIVTLNSDGTAEYEGRAHAPRQGRFVGQVNLLAFGRLCQLLETVRFESLAAHYNAAATDLPAAIVRVRSAGGGDVQTVDDYGGAGPIEAWSVQMAIDGVAQTIDWKPAQP